MKSAIKATIISTMMLSIIYAGGDCFLDSKANTKDIMELKTTAISIARHDTAIARHEEMFRMQSELLSDIKKDLEWIKRRMMEK